MDKGPRCLIVNFAMQSLLHVDGRCIPLLLSERVP